MRSDDPFDRPAREQRPTEPAKRCRRDDDPQHRLRDAHEAEAVVEEQPLPRDVERVHHVEQAKAVGLAPADRLLTEPHLQERARVLEVGLAQDSLRCVVDLEVVARGLEAAPCARAVVDRVGEIADHERIEPDLPVLAEAHLALEVEERVERMKAAHVAGLRHAGRNVGLALAV